MRGGSASKLLWSALALAALAVIIVFASGVWLLARYQNAADYPGAEVVAGQNSFAFWPHLVVKRDTAYRTGDPFPAVYNFYSSGFHLGPEAYALGSCIQMARTTTELYVLERNMSAMVCDTPAGRMIFVMRAISVRLPR
jgi:hypothetical protein